MKLRELVTKLIFCAILFILLIRIDCIYTVDNSIMTIAILAIVYKFTTTIWLYEENHLDEAYKTFEESINKDKENS